ncbi:hypothetical protein ACVPOQ_02635 [Staphylococcus aureus]
MKTSRIKKMVLDIVLKKAELIDQVGYFIEPQDLFSAMIREFKTQDFDIEHLATAIRKVETSTLG